MPNCHENTHRVILNKLVHRLHSKIYFLMDRLYIIYIAYESVTEPLWPEEVVVPFNDKKKIT